jgi:hypothetical protein
MRSTYVLIEQSELHNFLRELDSLRSWARKMAGLSTSITAPAPLGMPGSPPDMLFNPFASSPITDSSGDAFAPPPAPTPRRYLRNYNPNRVSGNMDQANSDFGYAQPGYLGHQSHPLAKGTGNRDCVGMRDVYFDRLASLSRSRAAPPGPWQAPVKNGPHLTPVITRAPNAAHVPQRGVRYVRRPRRVRPERNAGNVEVLGDETEDDEYVEEEVDEEDTVEREAR